MFCPRCGKEFAPQSNFCSACGAPAAFHAAPVRPRIVRPRFPRMIAGVCSGFAIHYGWSVPLVRIFFAVFTCLTSGAGLLVYLALWLILPDAPYALPPVIYPNPAPDTSYRQGSAV